jgi:iron complex outermembrane receptor protein
MKKNISTVARYAAHACGVVPILWASAVHAQEQGIASSLDLSQNSVVISASKYKQDVHGLPVAATVITRAEIESSGVGTVNEAIMKLGGVLGRPSLSGGNEYSLDIGGFGDTAASNMVVVIDGIVYKQGDSSELRLSGLALDQIERIEIVRGASPVLYGEGAIAGVIHIITKASGLVRPLGVSGQVAASAGSYGTREAKGSVFYAAEQWSFNASGLDRRSDGYRQNGASADKNANVSAQYRGDGIRAGVSANQSNEHAQTPGGLTLTQYAADPRQAQPSSLSNRTYLDASANGQAAFIEANVLGTVLRLDLAQRKRDYDALAVSAGSPSTFRFETTSNNAGLQAIRPLDTSWGRQTFTVGTEKINWDQKRIYPHNPSFGNVTLGYNTTSYFLKSDLILKATGTQLSVGYRSEDIEKYQNVVGGFSPGKTVSADKLHAAELGFSQKLSEVATVYSRWAESYRLPNVDEFTSPAYDSNGSPIALRPQTSTDKELGLKYRWPSQARASVRWVRSDLKNEIIYDPANWANINLEPTRRQALEFLWSYPHSSSLSVSGSLSLRDAQFLSGAYVGKQVPMSPKQFLGVRADWRLPANQVMSWMVTAISQQAIAGSFNNANKMPGYATLDWRYAYTLDKLQLSILVKNLLDKKYHGYATTTSGYTVYPDMGRNLMLTAKYKF